MNCRTFRRLLRPYIDDALNERHSKAILLHCEHCLPCRHLLQYTKAAMDLLNNPLDESQIPVPEGLASRVKAGVRRAYDDSRVRETAHTPAIGSPAFTAVCASLIVGALVLYLGMTNWYGRTYDAKPQTPSPRLVIAQATHQMTPIVAEMDLFNLVKRVEIPDVSTTLPVMQKSLQPVPTKPAVQVASNVDILAQKNTRALNYSNAAVRYTGTYNKKPVRKIQSKSVTTRKRPAVLVSGPADTVRYLPVRQTDIPLTTSNPANTTGATVEDTGMIAGLIASHMIESLVADASQKPAMITSSATMTPHVVAVTSTGAVAH